MKFKKYWLDMPVSHRKVFAARCGASFSTLNQAAHGRVLSPEIAIAIERETFGAVCVEDLRPDLPWHVVRSRPARKIKEVAA